VSRCPLCDERRGKRACPAKRAQICSACCGSKRLVEIACPEDCAYLTGVHAAAWEGRETEHRRDVRRVAPQLQALDDTQTQLFFLGLVETSSIRARHRGLDDDFLLRHRHALRCEPLSHRRVEVDARQYGRRGGDREKGRDRERQDPARPPRDRREGQGRRAEDARDPRERRRRGIDGFGILG